MYIDVPVEEWGQLLEDAEIPNLRLTMCGYFGTALSLLYPPEIVDSLVDFLLGQFTEYEKVLILTEAIGASGAQHTKYQFSHHLRIQSSRKNINFYTV